MILVTGGLGYIGSHMAAILLANGHDVILVDNLCNSKMEVLERLEYMAGRYVTFIRLDVRNTPALQRTIEQYAVTAIVHTASTKAIPDSINQPLDFYNNNVTCTTSILRAMQRTSVKTLLFCSSLAVYGADQAEPVTEDTAFSPASPYAKSLQMSEQIIQDVAQADTDWRIAIMRYGNVAGAYPTGVLGEWPGSLPSNLMPYLVQLARHERETLEIYGDQYKTPDGTGVRDYIHIMDAVEANMHALSWLFNQAQVLETFNICTGKGTSVKEVAEIFAEVTQQPVPQQVVDARTGDVGSLVGNAEKAYTILSWQAKRSVEDMATDLWRFYQFVRPIG
ncbi:UDP-glucose 4-epimerase GalE [Alkanindiges hydrocarboniclasticus]|uniref:UDP-glucose 4-epimerase n=1 Tax=Alkanindiges hydrocarboniclasticus TaxID=1907941 RepID=A0A1S8CQF8_9GAMM|nr:UDP-glucose 4-epimerase GalE [Alkanindiges hydrocarboniclasticus]ONG37612.1 UDP-glucose 4-epimerase GalE [Alkanindiges hydrocarboniclasticus]